MRTPFARHLIALTLGALFFSNAVSALPTEEMIEHAEDCLSETNVNQFNATPGVVFPWRATILSWQVTVPQGCGISLSIRGIPVNPTGSRLVTPTFPEMSYALEGRMSGVRSILARAPVAVNTDACREFSLSTAQLASTIQGVLDDYDEGESEIQQTRDADIAISPSGLAITMYFEVDKVGPNPSVQLAMRLLFNTVNGEVVPTFAYFHPQASTYLPDEWVESKIYAKSAEILETFKTEINALVPSLITPAVEKLFSVETIDQAVLATVCPFPRRADVPPIGTVPVK